jgi:hypothetical protein
MVANISDSEALNLIQAAVEQAWMALPADRRTVTPGAARCAGYSKP